jgi:hypothetical protein
MELVWLCDHMQSIKYLATDFLSTISLEDIYIGILEK